MGILTFNEEIILIAICRLGGSVHGAAIRDEMTELSQKEIVYGTLYNSLEYLIRKDYVTAVKGEPTPERGGKRKTIYSITPEGKAALIDTRKMHDKLWKGMPNLRMDTTGKSK